MSGPKDTLCPTMSDSKTLVSCTIILTNAGISRLTLGYNDVVRLTGSKLQNTHNYPTAAQK
jgi:hypothetical protein